MSRPENQPKLSSVQALRGLAAVLVMLFHLHAMFLDGGPRSESFGALWARGYAGVDMFFVISGFIMVYVGQMAAPDKVTDEAIMPYLVKSLLLIPQFHDPVLGLGWTLIHEMLFYILFAAGLLLPRKFLPLWLLLWTAVIALGYFAIAPAQHARNYLELLAHPLNLEFIMGAFVAYWLMDRQGKSGTVWLWAGAGLFIISLLFHLPERGPGFSWMRALIYGLPSAMIILGAVWMERQDRLNVPPIFVHIGNWSYSLYLSHILVLLALKRLWGAADGYLPEALKWGAPGWLDNALYITLALTLSLITAWLSYHAVERTSLRLLRGRKNLRLE